MRPVLVTDEQSASFLADGVWRASGRMACVNVVPGAGLTHALSGIAEAYMDNVPMLVLGCGIRRDTGRAFQLHDVPQEDMVRPVVKGTFRPESGEELYDVVRRACFLARDGAPGPVFVEVPANLYLFTHPAPRPEKVPSSPPGRRSPEEPLLTRAADMIRSARRPLLYVGAGAAGAAEQVRRLAEWLEAPVSTTFQGKGVFPESHPLSLWPGFGEASPPFVREVAAECDLTLAVGCRFGEVATGSYGMAPHGPLVHVDVDSGVLNRNYPAEVAIEADAESFLEAILGRLGGEKRAADPELRARIRRGHEGVWKEWDKDIGGAEVAPAHLLRTAQEVFGPRAVFTTDSGNGTFLAMECLRLDAPGRFLAPVDYSCMGYAVPAAFLMTGLELLTAAREGVGVVVLVLRDRELAQIAQFQATAMNRRTASAVPEYDLAGLATGLGIPSLHLSDDGGVRTVLEEARDLADQGRPVLVDVAIDYTRKTFFTRGVVKANLGRLPLKDQMRFVARALARRLTE